VAGAATSNYGIGVRSTGLTGVLAIGSGINATGVYRLGTYGVRGPCSDNSGSGVRGDGGSNGTFGVHGANTGGATAMDGMSDSETGVYGVDGTGAGVEGNNTGIGPGAYGKNTGSGVGVEGATTTAAGGNPAIAGFNLGAGPGVIGYLEGSGSIGTGGTSDIGFGFYGGATGSGTGILGLLSQRYSDLESVERSKRLFGAIYRQRGRHGLRRFDRDGTQVRRRRGCRRDIASALQRREPRILV
jgi:hypothetical protein